jgi:uncharacterized protein YyaL (SSP411 family)
MMKDTVQANQLSHEKSPYLLQHAHNPVDWFPWGEEAFAKARSENKPVLLSIGYSTCHWCHVMEHESFDNPETAAIMNERFVSIKVDREERPDIDGVYMQYVMATTGSGGWPMTVFLTPDKKPFFGGTYFPPADRFGIPGFPRLLTELGDAWRTRRGEIEESAESATAFLGKERQSASGATLGADALRAAGERFVANFDPEHGGFGRSPKFPRSHVLSFVLRHWARTHDAAALNVVEKTLTEMFNGGMYDRLGGGFHRYSTDGQWRIPHFEKMLYDQALLAKTYCEAYQATKKPIYARIARQTLDYVLRDMTSPEGGFYSAEDADSDDPHAPGHKREGAFFVWTVTEIDAAFAPKDAALFKAYFGVVEAGNALSDPHNEFQRQNVLYVSRDLKDVAAEQGWNDVEARGAVERMKKELFELRKMRPAPYKDDKILTDWNGLMISALAYAAQALGEPRYRAAAVRAAEFVSSRLKDTRGRLLHRYRAGESGITATVNDYAFMTQAYLETYQATFDVKWLALARETADGMTEFFADEKNGGFYLTGTHGEALIARPKESYDGAVPSGNSVAALSLLLLERFTADPKYRRHADACLSAFSAELEAEPTAYPQFYSALDFAIGPSVEIVFASSPEDPSLEIALKELGGRFIPNRIVLFHPEGPAGEAIEKIAAFVKGQRAVGGAFTAYVCRDYACGLPAKSPEEFKILAEELEKRAAAH